MKHLLHIAAVFLVVLVLLIAGSATLMYAVSRSLRHRETNIDRVLATADIPVRRGLPRSGWAGTRNADDRWLDILQGDVAGRTGNYVRLPGRQLRITAYTNADGAGFGPWLTVPGGRLESLSTFWPAAAYSDFGDRCYYVWAAAAIPEGKARTTRELNPLLRIGSSQRSVRVTSTLANPNTFGNWWQRGGGDFRPEGLPVAHVPPVARWRWVGVTCDARYGDVEIAGLQYSPAPAAFLYRPGLQRDARVAHAAIAGWVLRSPQTTRLRCIVYLADGSHRIFPITGKPSRVGPLTLIWEPPDEVVQRLREASSIQPASEAARKPRQGSGR